jgi:hypothetical protein
MKNSILSLTLFFYVSLAFTQNLGIVRKNYISSYFDSTLMANIDVLDSATIRLGSIDPITGIVSNIGSSEYNSGINLNGATLNPYSNQYYIGSGFNLLTFDMNSGNIINNVPITGPLPSASFQNLRFNPSDSIIYGMVPNNFYSFYYDSILMTTIQVLDSTQILFASINPSSGQYSLIGNSSYNNIYTLAGNSIDPYQMVYYYSAVNRLIGIDINTGSPFSSNLIQLPSTAIFENITYSCADTAIYGITRQNYISLIYDSILMTNIEVVDSTTFRLSKINPNTGAITFVSPYNIGVGGNLSSGSFIDPISMTFFFNNGNQVVGVSLVSGLITSSVTKTFSSGAFAFNMMRSTQNCYGATKIRNNTTTDVDEILSSKLDVIIFPNPAQNEISLKINASFIKIEILDFKGAVILETKEKTIDISSLSQGIFLAKVFTQKGEFFINQFIKN